MESSTITAAPGRAVDAPTVTEALRRTAANNPEIVAVRTADDSVSLTWSELLERVDAVLPLIYTSGTTGPPKGVMLSHHAIMVSAHAIEEIIPLEVGGRLISWLPAAHIAERMAHHYIPVIYAGSITCCPNPREVVSYLPQVRPTWFFAVPRIWEKLKAGLETMQAAQPEDQRRPIQEALQASIERLRLRQRGEPVPPQLESRVAQADEHM